MQHIEQDHNVGPGSVVADHQITAVRFEVAMNLNLPLLTVQQFVQLLVRAYPPGCNLHAAIGCHALHTIHRHKAQHDKREHHDEPEGDAQAHQGDGEDTDDRGRKNSGQRHFGDPGCSSFAGCSIKQPGSYPRNS